MQDLEVHYSFTFAPDQAARAAWKTLLAPLPALISLTSLSLTGLPADLRQHSYFRALSDTLQALTSLQELHLQGDMLGPARDGTLGPDDERASSERLATALGALTGLTRLAFAHLGQVLPIGMIFQSCRQLSALRNLSLIDAEDVPLSVALSGDAGPDADGTSAASFLSGLTGLTDLTLKYRAMSERQSLHVFDGLAVLSRLRSLRCDSPTFVGMVLLARTIRDGYLPRAQAIFLGQADEQTSELNWLAGRDVFTGQRHRMFADADRPP
jgi:hypothetical protein